MQAIAPGVQAVLGQADVARHAGHDAAAGKLCGVRAPSRRSSPIRVALPELHEAIPRRPFDIAETRVVDGDDRSLQEGLKALLPKVVEGPVSRDMLYHVSHAVHVHRLVALAETFIGLVHLLELLAHLRVVHLPTADRRHFDLTLVRGRALPPLEDRVLLLVRGRNYCDLRQGLPGHHGFLPGEPAVVGREHLRQPGEEDDAPPGVRRRRLRRARRVGQVLLQLL
mmetsp:Transcript_36601/g.105245  ORF Transcript_36601/g.105245 Transcript_36601/m.105245 type:complete len:225 (+) Transcript_36601:903-1577(+)